MAEKGDNKKRVVLIAMDGSPQSEKALDFYMTNIRKDTDEIVVAYCVHHRAQHTYSFWMPVDPNIIVHAYHEESKKGDEVCKKLKEKLESYKVGGKVLKLEGGDPGHTIVNKAEELDAKLIVVGSRGLGIIRRKLLGSVSEFILHHAHVPVFICHE